MMNFAGLSPTDETEADEENQAASQIQSRVRGNQARTKIWTGGGGAGGPVEMIRPVGAEEDCDV